MMEESVENGVNRPPSLAPFLTKCYDMVEDPATDSIVSWSSSNDSFIIWDMTAFSKELLPKYFKHSNFSSFVRQLNTYGFRKADPDRWEFVNEGFIKGQKHLLRTITRKKHSHGLVQQKQPRQKNTSVGACVEVGKFGLHEEVESLKRDKNVLMQELVKVRQHQQTAEARLLCLTKRLQGMEKGQQQMLSFLAMAMQNPGFLSQLFQQNENWRMADTSKKRRHPTLEQGAEDDEPVASDGQIVMYQPPRNENTNTVFMPILDSNVSRDFENGANEIFMNMDFMPSPMEKDLLSTENGDPFIISDLLDDDQMLEQLLLAGPFLENVEETESSILDSMDTGMEVESTENKTSSEMMQLESTVLDNSSETSQKLDIVTEQMELLPSETNSRQEVSATYK
ncbi:heat stress transcription factor A-1-like [Macadamia integrifolia]|uniref:heat stress transcription factor A-1-like n=1 Tax=Macadamia integrifolia TaxID=60698 RepID=UPI001C4E67DB|nr:heat stress transcription factor A-1-like [Macadamia integrifolia]XP_042484412.1 heat stress transcription factor A-1-like [Macadamia integrifolia]